MSIRALADCGAPMDKAEVLARAWVECDPNRAGNTPGSGFHPDDIIGQSGGASSLGSDSSIVKEPHDTPLTGKPRWHWFIPRAEALEAFLFQNGYEIKPL